MSGSNFAVILAAFIGFGGIWLSNNYVPDHKIRENSYRLINGGKTEIFNDSYGRLLEFTYNVNLNFQNYYNRSISNEELQYRVNSERYFADVGSRHAKDVSAVVSYIKKLYICVYNNDCDRSIIVDSISNLVKYMNINFGQYIIYTDGVEKYNEYGLYQLDDNAEGNLSDKQDAHLMPTIIRPYSAPVYIDRGFPGSTKPL